MKIGYHIENPSIATDPRFGVVLSGLRDKGAEVYEIRDGGDVRESTAVALSFGGDGTFLSTARLVSEQGVPILGVNFGRLGFLSENSPEGVVSPLLEGRYSVEERSMLQVGVAGAEPDGFWPYALNEVSIHRNSTEMIGIDAALGGMTLPTYWADGLLVATSTGSTAYNLSAGGPICTPDAGVLMITPVAPHNLGIRPLVIPADKEIVLGTKSRASTVILSLDNRSYQIEGGAEVTVKPAPFALRRVNLGQHSFIDALRSRFFWGQDVRNMPE